MNSLQTPEWPPVDGDSSSTFSQTAYQHGNKQEFRRAGEAPYARPKMSPKIPPNKLNPTAEDERGKTKRRRGGGRTSRLELSES